MKTLLGIAAIVTLGTNLASSAERLSGPIFNAENGHTYYLLTSDTWESSKVAAAQMGGHLASIDNASENSWIFSTFANFGGSPRGLWIGLTDADQEGVFVWSNGSASSFRNWSQGEPNDGHSAGEDIVHIWHPGHEFEGQWNDQNASATEAFGVPIHGVVEISNPVLTIRVSQIQLQWQSKAGVKYRLQVRARVEDNWQNIGEVMLGTGNTLTVLEPVQENSGRQFYQIGIVE